LQSRSGHGRRSWLHRVFFRVPQRAAGEQGFSGRVIDIRSVTADEKKTDRRTEIR
jgi:hypothetical protein